MRDDELDELLAAADRQFQQAFHAMPEHRADGLAAVIGQGKPRTEAPRRHEEVRERRTDLPALPHASLPPFLLRQIQIAVRLLKSAPTGTYDAIRLLTYLRQGLEDRTLRRDQALALVHEARTEVSEAHTRMSRERVLTRLQVIEAEVKRLFDDADDHVRWFC